MVTVKEAGATLGHTRNPISRVDLERELVCRRGGLYRFMRMAWDIVESTPFVPGWHLEELCNHLEAVSYGEISRLIINIPPGCTKSLTVSVFWPVWDWCVVAPWRKFMFGSFDATLSQRDALRAKQLVQSEWFQKRFGFRADQELLKKKGLQPLQILSDGEGKQNTATVYWTSGGGLRFSTSTGGKSTGWHAHIQVVDDPTKPQDLQGGGKKARKALEKTDFWWTNTMASRKADPQSFARVIMMQRLHAQDLAGKEIKRGGYVHLYLPMRYRGAKPCKTQWIGNDGRMRLGGDRRHTEGELLWPARYTEEAVCVSERELGPQARAAQLQQNPTSETGVIFKRDWFQKRWTQIPAGCQWLQSWDCTFDDTEDSDFVVGQVWAHKGGNFYLVDEVRGRMSFPATVQAVKDLAQKWPQARTILIENKANGPAVIRTLQGHLPGVIGWNPGSDSKEARAQAVSGYYEAGNVWLPAAAEWVGDHVEEMVEFPKGALDDRIDAATQALLRFTAKLKSRLGEAMANIS